MIIDSSAVVAILRQESDAALFAAVLDQERNLSISAATVLETSIVVGEQRHEDVDELLSAAGVELAAFDRSQLVVARSAYARYGKRSGSPARLNFGDCISYALATVRIEPLLFKGNDFTHTDVQPAVPAEA